MPSLSITTRPGAGAQFSSAIGQIAHSRYADAAICAALILLTAALLLPSFASFPMDVWDESRNANNAIEMAASGHWLVTTFNGVPDHWNTKPPLLIWMMAALLRAGLPPLLAVRLPSIIASMATVTVLFLFCRIVLRDRLAGVSAALLVLASSLFMGRHVSFTGDYDALLTLLVLVSVLAFWRYVDAADTQSVRWLAIAGTALTLAMLTKGIAALIILPGLLVYLVMKQRLLWAARDPWLWLTGLTVLTISTGYYMGRETLDPGYLQAVWENELGGRYLATLDAHRGGPIFYLSVLFLTFQPGILLTPLVLRPLLGEASRRRDVVLITLLAAASLLIVITIAKTKYYWYAAPTVPLLSLAVGIALTDAFASSRAAYVGSRVLVGPQVIKAAIFIGLGMTIARGLYVQNFGSADWASLPAQSQLWYGAFIESLHADGVAGNLLIIDGGVRNDAGLKDYHPVADFYRKYFDRNSSQSVAIVKPRSEVAAGARVLTCDPNIRPGLEADPRFTVVRSDPRCLFGQMRVAGGPG